ncbi:M48 family metalloprotease [Luteolibacter yonseiensis]|uniref:M48 family metalloprotease n=1 Tax=Luteolibacter yonseiensis TaxID=1144680 RepID=A0A934QZM9_9BACT|nr:M56 family metallopeptidase [Luteolibacter yonseiensis]MBK1814166.1 M48 family metalloprotease [Luteolibacter yonseiensis]
MIAETIRSLSDPWSVWAIGALADGTLALLVAGILWMLFRKVIPARWGMWLFLLVMAKSLIPTPVAMPGWDAARFKETSSPLADVSADHPEMMDERSLMVSASEQGHEPFSIGTKGWLFVMWSGVVAVGAGLSGLRAWRTWRLVRDARTVEAADLGLDADWVTRLDLAGTGLRESDELSSPAAWGGRKPCVILPTGLAEKLSQPQLRWTLAHEVSHLRHGDWAVSLAQAACALLCFFNPAVWVAGIAASALRERACDESAVRVTGILPKESATGFLSLVERAQSRVSFNRAMMPGLSLEGRTARWRMRWLLRGIAPLRQSSAMTAAVLLALLLLLPSFRGGFAGEVAAHGEIQRLEARVTDLEGRLQKKSDREERVELNQRRASARQAEDANVYDAEQRNAIETIYQEARRKLTTAEKEEVYAELSARYPRSNRTGCAKLFSARAASGTVRERKLREVIAESGDCYYLDGTSVGGVARLILAQDLVAAGRTDEAGKWLDELEKDFAGYLDHEGNPLEDAARELRAGL